MTIFVVIAIALLMSSLDGTVVATVLHTLQSELGTTVSWAGWTITSYSLGLIVMLPISGRLADQFGRRRTLMASVAVFSLASLACGFAGNIYLLIVLRAVQAAGGAGITPAAAGLVVEHFGSRRDRYLGLFGSIFPLGAMIGPVVGGLFVEFATWRWAFFVNVPIGLALVVLALRVIPPDRPFAGPLRLAPDLVGIALLAGGLLLAMLSLGYVADHGLASASAAATAGAGLVAAALLLAVFVLHIRRTRDPIITPQLIYGRGFGAVNALNIAYGGASLGLVTLVPLYATSRFGIESLSAGALLVAESSAAAVVGGVASFVLRRTGYRWPIAAGAIGMASAMVLVWLAPGGVEPHSWLVMALILWGVGAGMFNPASRNAGVQLAPELASSIAALRTTGMQVGMIAAVSITTAVMSASDDPAAAQAIVFAAFAALIMVLLPVVPRVPEHRGAW